MSNIKYIFYITQLFGLKLIFRLNNKEYNFKPVLRSYNEKIYNECDQNFLVKNKLCN